MKTPKLPHTACTVYRWDHSTALPSVDLLDAFEYARTAREDCALVVVRDADCAVLACATPSGKRGPNANDAKAWAGRMLVILAGQVAA